MTLGRRFDESPHRAFGCCFRGAIGHHGKKLTITFAFAGDGFTAEIPVVFCVRSVLHAAFGNGWKAPFVDDGSNGGELHE